MTLHNTHAPLIDHEAARLGALRRLALLDTAPSEQFDRITRMAARVFGLPIAAVSLTDTDRQWFKSRVGVDHASIPRERAPCAAVADSSDLLIIDDLLADPYFKHSPLASSGVRFYAGAPLITHDGYCLGAMCVLGMQARSISADEKMVLRDLAAMVMSHIELRHTVTRVDALSGLPNRKQFVEDFGDLTLDRPPGERRLAVLVDMATADQLSNAARVMGASYLDDMMKEAVDAWRTALGVEHKLYQLAATQFLAVTPAGADDQAWRERLQGWLDSRVHWSTSRFVTTPAIGIAPFVIGEDDCQDVLRIAQNAVQDAHRAGQGLSMYSWQQDAAYRRRFTLINEFGVALKAEGQLSLVYQPRIDLATGKCLGAEALLRWTHPDFGAIPPGEFMPLVEQTLMIRPATLWVLAHGVTQLAAWHAAGTPIQLSVNISSANLLEDDFVDGVLGLLASHALAPGWLELEVTESAIMENQGKALRTLAALDAAGVRLAIDDFGTGYSSLSYLQSIPAHVVKIDQSFIRHLDHDERDRTLVKTMITLSHELGFRVVAEGIETEAVRTALGLLGCDEGQGYLFARPMAPDALAAWMAQV